MDAYEAWEQVTTFEQRLRLMRGEPITVTMTREQHEAIVNDPLRIALRDAFKAWLEPDRHMLPDPTPTPEPTPESRIAPSCGNPLPGRWGEQHPLTI